ncbi:MAG: glutathione peroxidase [Bacteroidia bacterium]|jgi:glutathione peroxidase
MDGLTVLAFPCNQFGAQEPGTNEEILKFAQSNYQINFPMFSKIEVNGDDACELFQILTSALPDEEGKNEITWNFTKFLVDAQGMVVARYSPMVTPEEIGDVVNNM